MVLGFDMETDIGSWTPFYEGLKRGTPKIIRILRRHGVKVTFFFTAEAAETSPVLVKSVKQAGHEVGCHGLYHETLGDELFPIPGIKPILHEEVYRRISLATEKIKKIAGVKPVSFRCPRLWGSTAVLNVLESLGYKSDASYPMYYYEEQLVPYHPNRRDWTKEGNMNILEIPNFADMTIKSKDPYGRDRDQWPLYRTDGAKKLIKHIENFISFVNKKNLPVVVLCFYFHPWEFVKMPRGPIHYGEGSVIPDDFLVKNCGGYALKEFSKMIDYLKSQGAVFITAKTLAEKWNALKKK